MALALSTYKPAHTYYGKIIVSYMFTTSRPPRGITGYIDWIMDGQISDLIIKNKVKGTFCESLLLVTGSKIKAHFFLIIGAGNPKKLSLKMVREIGRFTMKAINGLKVSCFGLYPHDLFLSQFNIFKTLDELFAGLKDTAEDETEIVILSDGQEQEEIIEKWLKDRTYILKPVKS
jgi:hypothetical protein